MRPVCIGLFFLPIILTSHVAIAFQLRKNHSAGVSHSFHWLSIPIFYYGLYYVRKKVCIKWTADYRTSAIGLPTRSRFSRMDFSFWIPRIHNIICFFFVLDERYERIFAFGMFHFASYVIKLQWQHDLYVRFTKNRCFQMYADLTDSRLWKLFV